VSFFSGIKQRLTDGLRRSQEFLSAELKTVFEADRPIDDTLFEELEEILIAADLGAAYAADFKHRAKEEQMFGTVTRADQLRPLFRRFLIETLAAKTGTLDLSHQPTVLLMLGVNGAGKTTTCAKLAAQLKADGKSVLLAAADTFRAAAIEQLQTWAERVGVEVIHQAAGSDPAAVVFDAVKAATARRTDVLIIDTAGRLHTKSNLMDELIKLKRVAERLDLRVRLAGRVMEAFGDHRAGANEHRADHRIRRRESPRARREVERAEHEPLVIGH